MCEISVSFASMAVDVGRLGGIGVQQLKDSGFDGAVLEQSAVSIRWDLFMTLLEELERLAGGGEALEKLFLAHWAATTSPCRVWAAHFPSAASLLRFVLGSAAPAAMPFIRFEVDFEDAQRLDARIVVPEPYRATPAFWRLVRVIVSLFPLHAGMPPARVELLAGSRSALLRCFVGGAPVERTPASTPMTPRTRAAELLGDPAFAQRVDVIGRMWGLSRRQTEVMRLLVVGMSNKEIAARIDRVEGTVELHVTHLLRKARVTTRTELMAVFWAPVA